MDYYKNLKKRRKRNNKGEYHQENIRRKNWRRNNKRQSYLVIGSWERGGIKKASPWKVKLRNDKKK